MTPGTIPVAIDGGDPVGVLPGDHINVDAGGNPVQFMPGPQGDEGGFQVAGDQAVSFVHIESASVLNGNPLVLNGANGDDAITITARDGSTHPGADGVQDFTVSINNGPEFLFLNTAAIQVNALAGDDTITVRTPAPNDAVWNVQAAINGGASSAGDKVIIETPYSGAESAVYTPTSATARRWESRT